VTGFASYAAPRQIERDQRGRPLITYQGKRIGYTRATTLAGALEDTFNLSLWARRQVILGLLDKPALLLTAASGRDNVKALNQVAEDAMTAAGAGNAAAVGTAIHALAEKLDAGQDVGPVPGDYQRDLDAYRHATRDLKMIHSEGFVVVDEYQVAGSFDRIVEYQGERFIADIKTGSIDYGAGKIAIQLAIYAHGQLYDQATDTRTPLPGVNGQRGIVIHVPAGTGTARLLWVDIEQGWRMVPVAHGVRQWNKRRDLFEEWDAQGAMTNLVDAGLIDDPISAQLRAAASPAALVTIWEDNATAWTNEHTATAAARKQELLGGKA
jgi:hypothetical protein